MLEWRDVVGFQEFFEVSNNGRIRRKEHSNLLQKDIALLCNVTPGYVSEIKTGKIRSDITGYKYNGRNNRRKYEEK